AHDIIRLKADGLRVRADERAAENSRGPMRHLVAFELLEQRLMNLRPLGDGRERHAFPLALTTQTSTKTFMHHERSSLFGLELAGYRARDVLTCIRRASRAEASAAADQSPP